MREGNKYFIKVKKKIDTALLEYIEVKNFNEGKKVIDAMSYSLMGSGKRIRPALCLASAEAVGGNYDTVVPLACAIEMIHTYSLIHDDLPSMDDDTLRRGKLTCHKRFNEATAILAGDALLSFAYEILAKFGFNNKLVSAENILRIIHNISKSIGFKGMIAGQMEDISSERINISKKKLKTIHFLKTGMLIKTAIKSGAIISNPNNFQLKKLNEYGSHLGLAFQITDDILNVIGTKSKLGKHVGTDMNRAKNTYPSIYGLEISKKIVKTEINYALDSLNFFDEKADSLRLIANYILHRAA